MKENKRARTLTAVLVATLICGMAALFLQIPTAKADNLTFTTSNSDGYILKTSSIYSTAHDAVSGIVYGTDATIIIGQTITGVPPYFIYRGFLFFDTSAIPNGVTIDSAVLSVYVSIDDSVADFNVVIQDGQPYPNDPLQTTDYYYVYYSGDGGSRSTSEIGEVGYWNITLNSDGLDWIQDAGTTKLCLRSSEDIANSAPSGSAHEAIAIRSLEYGAGYAPKLYVTYSVAAGYSTLTVSSNPEINAQFSVNETSYNTPTNVVVENNQISTLVAESAKIYGGEGYLFNRWIVNGTPYYTQTINLDITGDTTIQISYSLLGNLYKFYGPFDEETGYPLDENVTVTAYHIGGIPPYSFTFNGSWVYPMATNVQYFRFNFTNNSTREYWIDPSESVSPIYIFKGDTTTYTINFLDTTGILNTFPYVTAKRYVNGTLYTIEKRKVDAYKSVIMNLINTRTYQITLGNEATTYLFGDLLMTAQTAVQLVLRGVDFPKETLLLQKYVRIYGHRNATVDPNTITIVYEDTKLATVSVKIEINYGNFTNVYTTTIYASSFVLEWNAATYSVDYQVTATISHGTYGTLIWKQYFVRGFSEAPFSLAFLGNWTFDSTFLIPALIILCVAGCFSALNAEVGAILMSLTAIVLAWWGWIPIPAGLLVAAITLSILMALIYNKRRGAMVY